MTLVAQLLKDKPARLITLPSQASVLEAIRLMAEHNIGALPVVDEDRLVGMLSERDYARKVVLQGKSSTDTAVHEIMTRQVTSVGPESTLDACMQLMTEGHFRHLPVLTGGRLVGMLSIGDLVRAVIAAQQEQIAHLESYIRS